MYSSILGHFIWTKIKELIINFTGRTLGHILHGYPSPGNITLSHLNLGLLIARQKVMSHLVKLQRDHNIKGNDGFHFDRDHLPPCPPLKHNSLRKRVFLA